MKRMDLDNIKEKWNNSSPKSNLDEDQIRKMVSNISASAYTNLLRYEKIGIAIFILCLGVCFVFNTLTLRIIFVASGLIGAFWQFYKYRYLKQIDILNDSIIDVADKMAKYKKYLSREIFIGVIWAFLFFALYLYMSVLDPSKELFYNPDKIKWAVVAYIIIVTVVVSLGLLFYKLMYRDNIRIIENSLREVEEFKRES